MTEKQVAAHIDIIIPAVQEYFSLCHSLVEALCDQLGIPIAEVDNKLRCRIDEELTVGLLGDDWDYFFHGGQCRFMHVKTYQTVDIELGGYGNIDDMLGPWRLQQFVQTTPAHKKLSHWLNDDFERFCFVVSVLLEHYRENIKF